MIEIAHKALAAAMKKADEAEVFVMDSRELSIEVYEGEVETLKRAESSGLGIRVLLNGSPGFAYLSDLSEEAAEEAVRSALVNATHTEGDGFEGFAGRPEGAYPHTAFDETIESTPVEKKIELALEAEQAARKADDRVDRIESCGYEDVVVRETVLNSHGVEVSAQSSYCGLYVSLTARQGDDVQTGFSVQFKRSLSSLEPRFCGRQAARKATELLGAVPMDTERIPIVFDPYTATNLLGVLAGTFSAENALRGKSMFQGKIGEQVMAKCVSIVDDGSLPDGVMSASADAEGMPTQRTEIVRDGVFRTFLHNVHTARRSEAQTTGNAVRAGYAGAVGVGSTNLFIEGGSVPEQELIGGVKRGLYVTSLLGVHTANPISGDFSVGASGLLIEEGHRTRPVRGVVLSGNLMQLFAGVQAVADNLTFFAGKGAPSMLTERLTVSGN